MDTFFDRFLEYSRANHQPTTTNRYRAVIDHFRAFLETLGKASFLSEITAEMIDRYKVYRKDAWINPNGEPIESDDDIKEHTRKGARAQTVA